mmetsp:Transcript_54984/g.152276  ORF Transcript_54984/g.152276 Transcript_54984/m.152276 type:complete len:302 (+) Transcript_54984:170-1075(+)
MGAEVALRGAAARLRHVLHDLVVPGRPRGAQDGQVRPAAGHDVAAALHRRGRHGLPAGDHHALPLLQRPAGHPRPRAHPAVPGHRFPPHLIVGHDPLADGGRRDAVAVQGVLHRAEACGRRDHRLLRHRRLGRLRGARLLRLHGALPHPPGHHPRARLQRRPGPHRAPPRRGLRPRPLQHRSRARHLRRAVLHLPGRLRRRAAHQADLLPADAARLPPGLPHGLAGLRDDLPAVPLRPRGGPRRRLRANRGRARARARIGALLSAVGRRPGPSTLLAHVYLSAELRLAQVRGPAPTTIRRP